MDELIGALQFTGAFCVMALLVRVAGGTYLAIQDLRRRVIELERQIKEPR